MKNEQQFLDLIDSHFVRNHDFLSLGRGDDCAVLAGGNEYCVSSDLFLEDYHFRRKYFSASDIGYKALAVNISDIAGMGAKPIAFTMDLMVPSDLDDDFWNDFFQSMSSLARQNDIVLAGGDISKADKLGVSISIFGVSGSTGFIRRRSCQHGDLLFLVGDTGLARTGRLALEEHGAAARDLYPAAVTAHLRPKPKILIGTLLNAAGVSSLMDLSDGLARDIPRLIGPDLGANITLSADQLHSNVISYAQASKMDPIEIAILGGEDYALLGTVSPFEAGKAESVPGFTCIGSVTKEPGLIVNGQPFTSQGFDHFSE